jgi:type VI secretion system secreted protein VgrG
LLKDGGKGQVTCQEAATGIAPMRHESDVPDFLQELSEHAYPILIPLTCRVLDVDVTGLAANAASLVFFREHGVAEFDPLRRGVTGRQAYFLDVPGTDSAAALSVVSFEATEKMGAPTEVRIVLTHPQQLARADYLNLDAAFSVVPDDGPPRKFSGFIARFSTIHTTKDYVRYEIVLKSHLARLAAVTRNKIFQHMSTPDILAAILRSHGFRPEQMSFRLRGQYRKHLFRMQRQMSDLPYAHMLMEKAGIYCFILETVYGDQVVFADDIDHYLYDPQLIVPYREAAALEAGGVEAVTTIKTHTVTVPQSFTVADYNPEQAWERFRDEANVAPQDSTTYGQPYIYGTHHLDQAGAKWEAQLRHEAAIARQVIYEGGSNVLALQCARAGDGYCPARCAERPGSYRGHAQRRARCVLFKQLQGDPRRPALPAPARTGKMGSHFRYAQRTYLQPGQIHLWLSEFCRLLRSPFRRGFC